MTHSMTLGDVLRWKDFVRTITELYRFEPMDDHESFPVAIRFCRELCSEYDVILILSPRSWSSLIRYRKSIELPLPFEITKSEQVAQIIWFLTQGQETEQQRWARQVKERAANPVESFFSCLGIDDDEE